MDEKTSLFKRTWITGIIFLILVILLIITPKIAGGLHVSETNLEIIKHLLLTLMAIMGVHFLERAFLWKEIADWNKDSLTTVLQESNELVKEADVCGLKKVYPSREQAKNDVIDAVKNAKKRVWLSGIGLSQKINLHHNLTGILKEKISSASTFDIRILMLDALRSTAVFRTFLESSGSEVKTMLDSHLRDENNPPAESRYFYQPLYTDFHHGYSSLKSVPELKAAIRFYAHTPICWLIIADDVAFFQPYTFGRIAGSKQKDRTIGHLMPVFEFHRESDQPTFEILEDHFRKLWLTSNTDLFHIGAINKDRDRIVHKIFKNRAAWLKHVYTSLHHPNITDGIDRRTYPRKRCPSGIQVTVELTDGGNKTNLVAEEILNFSCGGIALELKNDFLTEGGLVKLTVPEDLKTLAAEYFRHELLGPTEGCFRVVHSNANGSLIGLAAQALNNTEMMRL
jgi:hypothetical protein